MPEIIKAFAENLRAGLERHQNRPFLRAAMATSAFLAASDGVVSFSERGRMDQVLESLNELKIFHPHEAVDLFNEFIEVLKDDAGTGREEVLSAVEDFNEDPEAAHLLLRIGLAIAKADGDMSNEERQRLMALCKVLGLDATKLDT